MRLFLLCILFLGSCGIVAGRYPSYEPEDSTVGSYRIQRCLELDRAHVAWTTISTIGASISTAATTALPIVITNVPDETDRNNATIGVSITGILGSAMVFLGGSMAAQNEQEFQELNCAEFI